MRLRLAIATVFGLLSVGTVDAETMDQWSVQVVGRIARHMRPPSDMRILQSSRIARVRFLVDGRGRVMEPRIVESTGHRSIDQAALAAVAAASPLPPPRSRPGDTIAATLPVSFDPSSIAVRPLPPGARD